ncbi:YhcN/YlaJ family sporulation lipoprotein [Chungangia koreensis]|uniref:YhcN/YlaJ family sporulation lipoprotein n=1 Tax=Chungangia koreensis TaxID=752657 RepID=A0ABV8X336_9LACT
MNNLFKFAMVLVLAASLTACGNNNDDNNDQNNATDDTVNNGNVNEGTNTTGNDQNNGNDGMNGNDNNDNFSFSDEVADKVAAMDEVDNATVVLMGNNAYVAVGLKQGTNESEDLTKRISDEVKNVDGNIDQVYVSANPDFLKEINDYRTQYNNGQPVEGFFNEVTDAVQRVFPDAK